MERVANTLYFVCFFLIIIIRSINSLEKNRNWEILNDDKHCAHNDPTKNEKKKNHLALI